MDVDSLTLTLEGAAYLKDNSTMSKVKHVLGAAFDKTLGVEPRTVYDRRSTRRTDNPARVRAR